MRSGDQSVEDRHHIPGTAQGLHLSYRPWQPILFTQLPEYPVQHGFNVPMSGKGNCYDNAAVETFFKTIKAELIWRRSWDTRRQAEVAIFEYINGFTIHAADTQHWAGKAVSPSN